ncbi:MAG: phosphoribosylamine--glycine ligase, partial [Clostridia bacterium]|nr:phosphoribosylamine--glycine ligase [Clostridia bacterium]
MNVLVIGSGGREHTICWSLAKSPKVDKIYCLPGNGGISQIAECVPISVMDFDAIIDFVDSHKDIELTVVAPDDPLAGGLVDRLEEKGHRAFGPRANSAIIEASKAFSKYLMKKYGIPTAKYEEFDSYDKAVEYISGAKYPLVVKADGLALGKGVIICNTKEEGLKAVKEMMIDSKFKDAGKRVIVEEFMVGQEVSILSFCDGKTIIPMVNARDHKRAYDNDQGLNTGGMGTFSPSAIYTKEVEEEVMNKIILPTVDALNKEGRTFKGVLYFGLMLTDDGAKVVEYNARFGDPETQVVLPRLKTDLCDIFNAVVDGTLDKINIEWTDDACVCVVMASGGYPESYQKGKEITIGNIADDILIFHAGTAIKDGKLVTSGGRVLGVTAKGKDIREARAKAYEAVSKISFDGAFFRTFLGIKNYSTHCAYQSRATFFTRTKRPFA